MRDLAFLLTMGAVLPLALGRPFVGVLLWSWISFMNPHRLVYGFGYSMPWAIIVFGVMLVGCVVAREPRRVQATGMTWLVLLFMLCITLTSTVALATPAALVWAKWSDVMKVLVFLLVTGAMLTDRRRIEALVWMMALSLGFFGVRGGAFSILTAGAYRVYGPEGTTINDNNQLAAALLIALPLMNYLRLRARHRLVRIGLGAAMALTLLAILGSYSRGALLGLAAVTLVLWWNSRRKLLSAVALAGMVAVAVSFMPAGWMDRMHTIDHYQQDASAEERLSIWRAALDMAEARPLTGGGFLGPYQQRVVDMFDPTVQARAVHSIYFEVIGEHGFVAFAVWLSMLGLGVANTIRVIRATRGVAGMEWAYDLAKMSQVSIVAYLTAGAFLSMSYYDYFLTILVLIAALRLRVAETLPSLPRAQPARVLALRPRISGVLERG